MTTEDEPTLGLDELKNSITEKIQALAVESLREGQNFKLTFFLGEEQASFHVSKNPDENYKVMFSKTARNTAIRNSIKDGVPWDQLKEAIAAQLSNNTLSEFFSEVRIEQINIAIKEAVTRVDVANSTAEALRS